MMGDLIPEKTADGSYTLTSKRFNSSYHSIHGALTESVHVFIEQGFEFYIQSPPAQTIRVLEMGFGTALNAWLTFQEARRKNIKVHYTALEAFPPDPECHPIISRDEDHLKLLEAPWDRSVSLDGSSELYKQQIPLQDFLNTDRGSYDIIYYDAFGPGSQPELWASEIFQKLFQITAPGGVFVTYCAKGDVRRALQAVGYIVTRLPGPPFKRHMTRAIKPAV